MTILGVRIDAITRDALRMRLAHFFDDGGMHILATPNPEMLVLAHHDKKFRDILNQSDLNLPDGAGLQWAAQWLGEQIPERITGVMLVEMLSALAASRGVTLGLLGGEHLDAAKRTAQALVNQFPNLVVRTRAGGPINQRPDGSWNESPDALAWINEVRPSILCVALGHGKQESWIRDHLEQLPSVKIAVGIGGAFNVLGGILPRAPRVMQQWGMEWLWRLMLEPWRVGRIFTAVVIFPLLVIRYGKSV